MRLYSIKLFLLVITVLLSACGSSSDESNGLNENNNNDVNIPLALIGEWERHFERNGATGLAILEVTQQGGMQNYEIGNDIVMDEWYSGLASGITYKFWSEPSQRITNIDSNTITLSDEAATARIINSVTLEEVVTWDINSLGGDFDYELQNHNTLVITYPAPLNITHSYTKK